MEENKNKKEVIYMYYRKPTLKNLSQGARLEYVRRLRHMNEDDVVEYFGFGGRYPRKTFKSYEANYREPSKERLKDIAKLDVMTLGRHNAINLGIDYDKTTKRLLICTTLYIAIATALVGPISFMGLITTNIARTLFKTYKHSILLSGSVLIAILVLITGQLIVEHIFTYSIPVSVFITIAGGLYFLYLVLKQSKGNI